MTWTKLSDDFTEDAARAELTDTEFRVHVEAMVWSMRRETDGFLDKIDLTRGVEVADPWAAIQRLVALGWWEEIQPGVRWRVRHGMEHQPESDLIARRRELGAERQRRHRRKQAGLDPDVTP